MPSRAHKKSRVPEMKGDFSARGRRFGVVVSQFNELLTSRLLEGAVDILLRHGARPKDVRVVHVPGAFEVPLGAKRLISKFKPDAVITLSVVIKGQTRHFDQVVNESAKGIRELSMKTEVPVILGMILADKAEQAIDRVGVKQTNKGREWALAAIEMANLVKKLK